jgi:flagellar motor switch protein FliG
MSASIGSTIMKQLKESEPDLAQKIEDLMFVFDDIMEIDDRGIQRLLREVSSESLLLALKGADEAMKERIYKNMSKRAAEMLRDDLEAKGPVKLSEVEKAQKEILTAARRLSEAGEIALGGGKGGGGEQYV